MTFGEAIEAMKRGARVQRAGWNGKGMWLALTPRAEVAWTEASAPARLLHDEQQRDWHAHPMNAEALAGGMRPLHTEQPSVVVCDPHIDMRTAQGTLQPGWLASQADMLAEDWAVLP